MVSLSTSLRHHESYKKKIQCNVKIKTQHLKDKNVQKNFKFDPEKGKNLTRKVAKISHFCKPFLASILKFLEKNVLFH